jgi:hypothetical protein
MCEGCRKIEEKIAYYREMASCVMDRPTLDSIDVLVRRRETSAPSEDVTLGQFHSLLVTAQYYREASMR